MTIPDYETLMYPLIRVVANGDTPIRDATERLAAEFALNDEEKSALLPSGRTRMFYSRVHWAGTYLVQAGLLERPKRGVLRLTERGRSVLQSNPKKIDNAFLDQFHEFIEFKKRGRQNEAGATTNSVDIPAQEQTPDERIETAYGEMTAALRKELLDRITADAPEFFERLIIDLMLAMGYGQAGGGQHLGRTNDGGVDGIISEDALGLDVVFLQAKRYQPGNVVGVEKIQAFAGALVGQGATKGVFVTTSHYSQQAHDYAKKIMQRLVLIDGEELTRLLVRYNVGVRVSRTIDLKRIDLDYFNDGPDQSIQ